jgi:ATP-dependent Clp protease ATP-binding subunit ClpB
VFRPEFLNRVDDIIVFHPLGLEQLKAIVDIQVGLLKKNLAGKKIDIELTDAAKKVLVETGYDPAFGARPLKRTIQRAILNPLAMKILEGEFGEGDTVRVDALKGTSTLAFRKVETAKAEAAA